MLSSIFQMSQVGIILLIPALIFSPLIPALILQRTRKNPLLINFYRNEKRTLSFAVIIVLLAYFFFFFLWPVFEFFQNSEYLYLHDNLVLFFSLSFLFASFIVFLFLGLLSYKYHLQSKLLDILLKNAAKVAANEQNRNVLELYTKKYYFYGFLNIFILIGLGYFELLGFTVWVITILFFISQFKFNDYKFFLQASKLAESIPEKNQYITNLNALKKVRLGLFILGVLLPLSFMFLLLPAVLRGL